MDVPNLATSAGIAAVVIILVGALKAASSFDTVKYGALLSIALGVLLSVANTFLGGVVEGTETTLMATILVGIMGGAAASGIYSAGRGTAAAATNDPPPA